MRLVHDSIRLVCAAFMMFAAIFLTSCSDWNLKQSYRKFIKHEIAFPESMIKIEGGRMESCHLQLGKRTLVIYFDNTACCSCALKHLDAYQRLFDLAAEKQTFDVLIVFSPLQENLIQSIDDLLKVRASFPVFVDEQELFSILNPHIPADNRFHSFLLNEKSLPLFVGNPTSTDKLWDVFITALED